MLSPLLTPARTLQVTAMVTRAIVPCTSQGLQASHVRQSGLKILLHLCNALACKEVGQGRSFFIGKKGSKLPGFLFDANIL